MRDIRWRNPLSRLGPVRPGPRADASRPGPVVLRRLPPELVDSARADGAGVYATIVHVLLPVVWPALATVGLYAVAVVFNDYLYTTTFIQEPSGQTITGALGALITADIDDPGRSFAAGMLATAPLAIACAFFADAFASGLGTGIIEQ